MTLKDFITKAREIHRDKYDYSKVEYVDDKTKVCIIDPEYGEFLQTPNAHLQGQGCPKRSGKHVPTTEEWIASARKLHGDKYDYSKVKYVNGKTKVCIIDPEYGEFWQKPNDHLKGCGCPKRDVEQNSKNQTLSAKAFLKKARLVHGDKYDYSKVDYVNGNTKVCIISPELGEFWQTPNEHILCGDRRQCVYTEKVI